MCGCMGVILGVGGWVRRGVSIFLSQSSSPTHHCLPPTFPPLCSMHVKADGERYVESRRREMERWRDGETEKAAKRECRTVDSECTCLHKLGKERKHAWQPRTAARSRTNSMCAPQNWNKVSENCSALRLMGVMIPAAHTAGYFAAHVPYRAAVGLSAHTVRIVNVFCLSTM